ncbi:MAG: hypothetical protein ACREQF_04620, partial [Candidatus Binataceae bacterium]
SRVFVFDKSALYAGALAGVVLDDLTGGFTQVPATTFDNTLGTLFLLEDWNGNFSGSGFLRLSTITGTVNAPVLTLAVDFPSVPNPWSDFPPGFADFAPQPGTTSKIDNGDARMLSCIYRNGKLWAAHGVFLPAGGAPTRASAQWWQIDTAPGNLGAVLQFGRVDDPSGSLFFAYPTLAVNQNNDLLIGYSRFSATQFASGNYAFRAGSDPPNTLRDDTVLKAGEASYFKTFSGTSNRWGDYSSTAVDPVNDLDMWTIQEYAGTPSGGFDRWGTWWGKIAMAGTPTPTATATPTATPTPLPAGGSVALTKPGNGSARAGQNILGGNFRVVNTSGATESFQRVTIGFSNPALLASARLVAIRAGIVVASATVVAPSSSSEFALNKSVALKNGKPLNFRLTMKFGSAASGTSTTTQRATAITSSPAKSFSGLPLTLGTVTRL